MELCDVNALVEAGCGTASLGLLNVVCSFATGAGGGAAKVAEAAIAVVSDWFTKPSCVIGMLAALVTLHSVDSAGFQQFVVPRYRADGTLRFDVSFASSEVTLKILANASMMPFPLDEDVATLIASVKEHQDLVDVDIGSACADPPADCDGPFAEVLARLCNGEQDDADLLSAVESALLLRAFPYEGAPRCHAGTLAALLTVLDVPGGASDASKVHIDLIHTASGPILDLAIWGYGPYEDRLLVFQLNGAPDVERSRLRPGRLSAMRLSEVWPATWGDSELRRVDIYLTVVDRVCRALEERGVFHFVFPVDALAIKNDIFIPC